MGQIMRAKWEDCLQEMFKLYQGHQFSTSENRRSEAIHEYHFLKLGERVGCSRGNDRKTIP